MLCGALLLAGAWKPAKGATLTAQTNVLGPTPALLGCNAGHFFPGSNTRDWWRYAGGNGARLFLSASTIEPADDLPVRGDGVVSQAGFLARRAALRAAPLDTNFINWPYFTNHYWSTGAPLVPGVALRELRQLGVEACAQITVSLSRFSITNAGDWAGKWEVWQHFYAQAFHLAREFGVRRFQMFNEPNHPDAGGLTLEDYLLRLQLCSDAAQCALEDVNRLDGTSLSPLLLAPVTSGTANGSYSGWGEIVVTNLHRTFLGTTDPAFTLAHRYDYHQYNSAPASFGAALAALRGLLAADLAPQPPLPITVSEFNVHTAATFDGMSETLETPAKYSRFGAILANLAGQGADELYAFKFSQTLADGTVKKNGLLYVDNYHPPYNLGGITQAGEVWRLFTRASRQGGSRLTSLVAGGAEQLDVLAAHHTALGRRALFLVNNTNTALPISLFLAPWSLPAGQRVTLAEVSEDSLGAVRWWTNLSAGQTLGATMPSNSVWLLTAPTGALDPLRTLSSSDDAMVKDGVNRAQNYGASASLWVKNNTTNTGARNVAFIKFSLPPFHPGDLQFAVLRLWGSTLNGVARSRAHVFGLTNANWNQTTLRWTNAPNLLQGIPAGTDYTNNFVSGAGDSAMMLGQISATGTTPTEKFVDVTDFVRALPGRDITILLARETRFAGDAEDRDGLSLISTEGSPSRGPHLDLALLRDSDGDGLSDEAEKGTYQTDPDRPDTDGDGMNDGEEVRAGTNPLDRASVLRMDLSQPGGAEGGLTVSWSTVSNRWYRLFRAPARPAAPWDEIFYGLAQTSRLEFRDTQTTATSAWYQVRVEP